jgi:hypothetical protein
LLIAKCLVQSMIATSMVCADVLPFFKTCPPDDSSDDSCQLPAIQQLEMEEEDKEHLAALLAWSPSHSDKVPPPSKQVHNAQSCWYPTICP